MNRDEARYGVNLWQKSARYVRQHKRRAHRRRPPTRRGPRFELLESRSLPSTLSINNAFVTEGNSGTTDAIFTVFLSQATTQTVTVDFLTADGTARSPSDYQAQSGTLTFAAE